MTDLTRLNAADLAGIAGTGAGGRPLAVLAACTSAERTIESV